MDQHLCAGAAGFTLVQLRPVKTRYKWEKALMPRGIENSVHMKLAAGRAIQEHIYFHRKAFAVLSFVIAELGRIKDEGLALEATCRAARKTQAVSANKASPKLKQQAENGHLSALLGEAHALLSRFFLEHRIHRLLVAT